MTNSSPILRGPFRFLRPSSDDFGRLFPDAEQVLPQPHPIYASEESTEPIAGFPILVDSLTDELRRTLQAYLEAEEVVQIERQLRRVPNRGAVEHAWRRYSDLLGSITARATASSYGHHHLSIFWLFHSIAVSRTFRESPRRCRSLSSELHPRQAAEVKYRTFRRFLDGVTSLTRTTVRSAGARVEEPEEELYPALLSRMEENLLILTEDHVGADLKELEVYLNGVIGCDGREFRQRLAALRAWHREGLAASAELQRAVEHLVPSPLEEDPDQLLLHPGYISYLASLSDYDPETLLSPSQLEIWIRTLDRLKEFEILLAWRRMVVPVRQDEDRLRLVGPGSRPTGPATREAMLAESTRALDFSSPTIIDPIVHRFGLIYDMTDYAGIVSVLRHTGRDTEDDSFRSILEFQRWINRISRERRVKLEKYLGDGAFYSSRAAEPLLAIALRVQRRYASLVATGFPLDRGMRMALSFGSFRLVPVDSGEGRGVQRFEFLGHGINELSRLVTGKSSREIDEIKALLVGRGYSATEVEGFLAPLMRRAGGERQVAQSGEPFWAHIDHNGSLVNEGIVATEKFLARLGNPQPLWRIRESGRSWTTWAFLDRDEELLVGVRKLGRAQFKGLGELEVFHFQDAATWPVDSREELPRNPLLTAVRSGFRERTSKSG